MHICVSKLIFIDSDNGLLPGWHQAITNAGILLIWPLGTMFSEILIEILTVSFKKMHLKVLSAKWQSFCLGLNVLMATIAVPPPEGTNVSRKCRHIIVGFYQWKQLTLKHRKQPIYTLEAVGVWGVWVCGGGGYKSFTLLWNAKKHS